MSLLSIASEQSRQRGYEYFTENRVTSANRIGPTSYVGTVRGNGSEDYHVSIDIEHPRKSSCDCPFAYGRLRICKHMIALFFAVYPDEAEKYELERSLEEIEIEEELEFKRNEDVKAYLSQMSKNELVNLSFSLLQLLPDWQYDFFIDELLDDSEDFENYGEFEDDNSE